MFALGMHGQIYQKCPGNTWEIEVLYQRRHYTASFANKIVNKINYGQENKCTKCRRRLQKYFLEVLTVILSKLNYLADEIEILRRFQSEH